VRIEGQARLALPRERVFRGLSEPALLQACTPGVTRLEETRPDHFEGTLELKLPALSGRFEGSVDVTEREEPSRVKLRLKGKGPPGFVDGAAELFLADAEVGPGTAVRYVADVTVGGQVARLGQRMLSGVAKEMAGQFFEAFEQAGAAPAGSGTERAPVGSEAPALPRARSPLFAGLQLLWRLLLRALGLRRDPS
jgi:carbon monoxide dehydrogenase subunit G